MASYRFSALANGQHINFNPQQDLLFFNSVALAAASLEIGASADGAGTTFSLNGKTLTLDGVQAWELAPLNFKFANGSQLINSSLFNNFSHSLAGTAGDDLLLGSAAAQIIELASARTDGVPGNNSSLHPALSADGRFVAFESDASNLVPGDTNKFSDIFVKDLQTGEMQRVSTDSGGAEGISNGASSGSHGPTLSADGRFIAFQSTADNLVAGDTNAFSDIFVKDLQTGLTQRVSTNSMGGQSDGGSSIDPVLSADGRFVAFYSEADNLVAGDTNIFFGDIFIKDLQTGLTQQVSTNSAGAKGNADSSSATISADGRLVAFQSIAINLIPSGDTNNAYDIFVKDLQTGVTQRVSTDSEGGQSNGVSLEPALSADGRFVAFHSNASNLVAGDTNNNYDIFVKNLQTGVTQLVSTDSAGAQGNGGSYGATLSADGRFVVFHSDASNLVAGDTNHTFDIFVKDLQTGQTRRLSTDSTGGQSLGGSYDAALSADGSFVAFDSNASNLVAGDVNGVADIFALSNPLQLVTLTGGAGNDNYVIDNSADLVVEAPGGGTDTVRSSISYALPDNVENLTLTGAANLDATGNALNNTLTGNDGDNVFAGGAGVDTVSYANAGEGVTASLATVQAQDTGGAGLDRLLAIENLTGSAFDDFLAGNAGNNVLDGGTGADLMAGGKGNDVYRVDNSGDTVIEALGGGTDTVRSSISYTLGANLEKLTLTGNQPLSGTGNSLDNVIAGNAGSNLLDGGAAGIDTVSYATARAAVAVDLSITTVQFTLGAGADTLRNFENIIGSSFADELAGDNVANTLIGGGGADLFIFNSKVSVDTVTDFFGDNDRLGFSQAGIPIGDHDTWLEHVAIVTGNGGFANNAELVVVTGNIVGAITTASAAAAIGSATAAYAAGATALFAVDNGTDAEVFLFTSSSVNPLVSAAELTPLVILTGVPATAAGDYLFVA